MKLKLGYIILFVLLSVVSYAQDLSTINSKEDYSIIPIPTKLIAKKGSFIIDKNIVVNADASLDNEKEYLVTLLNSILGENIQNSNDSFKINLIVDETISSIEGYTLTVTPSGITIKGHSSTGVFYGIQTLRQLVRLNKDGKTYSIPSVEIYDEPTFVYRGMLLDVGRHFFTKTEIKKFIDLMALHKMNKLHWHLTDDQGWRIEIKKYPKLTEIGAWRKETVIGSQSSHNQDVLKYDGKRYGGFYTQEDIKEIVAYATDRHVTVIPEIELPGHCLSAIASYPQLGNTGDTLEVGTKWGVYSQVYSPKEETFKFIEDVLSEVVELFPSEQIHIGGDEVLKEEWQNSEYAQNLIKEKDLKDEDGLQSYFIKRVSDFLATKGKKIIGWNEITQGGLVKGATVMVWRMETGPREIREVVKGGNDVIMTPKKYCYFDYYQVKGRRRQKKEKIAIGGYLPVKRVYEFNPIPKGFNSEESKHILGGQGNVWTEYIDTYDYVEYMSVPRITALSEVLWSTPESRNWKTFRKRMNHITKLYDSLGINYARHYID